MENVPSSPREARIAALTVMAETVIGLTDGEKGNMDWKGRSAVLEAIALLTSVTRNVAREQCSDTISSPSCPERISRDDEISPTIQWMAEDNHKTDDLTIVERGRLFSEWSEKRRCLREG